MSFAVLKPGVVDGNYSACSELVKERLCAIQMHLVALLLVDPRTEELLVAALAEFTVFAVIEVVGIQEDEMGCNLCDCPTLSP